MRIKELPKVIPCTRCKGGMALMPWPYILRKGELVDGRAQPAPTGQSGEDMLLMVYICGVCGYSELYFPNLQTVQIFEVPARKS